MTPCAPANLFNQVAQQRLWKSAVEQIRGLIESGDLQVGQRLPSERELCRRLGISRVSLREATRVLESTGYVEVRPGRGTFVRDRQGLEHKPLYDWLRQQDRLIHQLFEFRELVEPGIAALAAQRRDRRDLGRLWATIEEMKQANAADDLIGSVAADAQFHRLLAAVTHNSIVDQLMSQMMHVLGEERRVSLRIPGQIERAIAGHTEILEAVERRQPELAEAAMRTHLRDARRYIDAWVRTSAGGQDHS